MSIFIIGHQGVGKSTVAQLLGLELKCRVAETGQVVTDELARLYARFVTGSSEHASYWSTGLTALKEDVRDQLETLGDLLTRMKPDCLVSRCQMHATIIVGIRRRCEVLTLSRSAADIWIRVERPNASKQGVFELGDMPCDFVVRNNGNLSDLEALVKAIAPAIK